MDLWQVLGAAIFIAACVWVLVERIDRVVERLDRIHNEIRLQRRDVGD